VSQKLKIKPRESEVIACHHFPSCRISVIMVYMNIAVNDIARCRPGRLMIDVGSGHVVCG